ncbi:hypothetical protein AAL_01268 [Moelleriella libera RCEF 2490]|uniref:Cyclin-like F-box n=1 Tax=Moelleriella libera RCEF 2490 TaxID=1081109 RepID=A0A166VLY4_9HYPO|nr:hypothetical protein AAL_01268 [Moelleriella libera RCEF 2490]
MNTLPPEILTEILLCEGVAVSSSARLTCRLFNTIMAAAAAGGFRSLAGFVDADTALARLESAARAARRRGITSLWSPRCSAPRDVPVPQSFLLAMYLALEGRQWHPSAAARSMGGTATTQARMGGRRSSSAKEEWDADSAISVGGMSSESEDEDAAAAAAARKNILVAARARGRDGEETEEENEEDEENQGTGDLTVENFASMTGRIDLDQDTLRCAMFRYALYLSYLYQGPGEAPSLWVFDTKKWPA